MVDRPFALHHHFCSRVTRLQGQPYPIATSSFSELSPNSLPEERQCKHAKGDRRLTGREIYPWRHCLQR